MPDPQKKPRTLEESIAQVRSENPDLADIPIEPQGMIGKFLAGPRQLATASPWTGSVSYNPEAFASMSPDERENTLTHELTHTRQTQATPYFQRFTNVMKSMIPGMDEEYYQRPREMEAFQSERDRSARLGLSTSDPYTGARDIQLPPVSKRRSVIDDYYARERAIRGIK